MDIEHFRRWQKDPITVEIFSALEILRNYTKEYLSDHNFLLSAEAEKMIPRLIGKIEAYEDILNLHPDDLPEESSNEVASSRL